MRDRSGNPFVVVPRLRETQKIGTDSPTRRDMPIKKPQPFIVKTEVCFFSLHQYVTNNNFLHHVDIPVVVS